MKNKFWFLFFAGLIALASMSFDMDSAIEKNGYASSEVTDFGSAPPPAGYYYRAYNLDTLTNANNDTLTLPVTLYSDFVGVFQVVRTNISGTTNVALKVEQSNTLTGNTDWTTAATGAGTGATNEALSFTSMQALRYRIILDGTGTQSTSYRVHVTLKRKN